MSGKESTAGTKHKKNPSSTELPAVVKQRLPKKLEDKREQGRGMGDPWEEVQFPPGTQRKSFCKGDPGEKPCRSLDM